MDHTFQCHAIKILNTKAFDNLPVEFDPLQPVTTEKTHAFALDYKNWKCDCLCLVFNLDICTSQDF